MKTGDLRMLVAYKRAHKIYTDKRIVLPNSTRNVSASNLSIYKFKIGLILRDLPNSDGMGYNNFSEGDLKLVDKAWKEYQKVERLDSQVSKKYIKDVVEILAEVLSATRKYSSFNYSIRGKRSRIIKSVKDLNRGGYFEKHHIEPARSLLKLLIPNNSNLTDLENRLEILINEIPFNDSNGSRGLH